MGSDGTSFHVSEPALCANGCGFFGSAATMNLCSKCFRDLRRANGFCSNKFVPAEKSSDGRCYDGEDVPVNKAVADRCHSCRKRVGVLGFSCKCGTTFCGTHRYPEQHNCGFDFKTVGRENIAKANVVVKADKIDHRI